MFYSIIESKLIETSIDELRPEYASVGYLTMEELKNCYEKLGFSDVEIVECFSDQTHFRNSIDAYDNFSFGFINIVNISNVHEAKDSISFFIKKNLFVLVEIIDKDGSTKDIFEKSVMHFKQNLTLEKVIYCILERLVDGSNMALEESEKKILCMEHTLVNGKTDGSFNKQIFSLKNRLTIQKGYFEQLIDIGEELQENENELFLDENLRFFKLFTDKVTRLSNNTQRLLESLIHLREAYEAALEYSLNRIMKVFTVVTTVFLPLTLIAGWYGMNFTNMPELTWKYGYVYVIILSIIVAATCLYLFRKKKLI